MTPEGQPVGSIHAGLVTVEAHEQSRVKMDEANHVEAVVLECRLEDVERARVQVREVRVGHQRARYRVVAFVAQHSLFDHAERAALEAVPVQGAHQREQVDVRSCAELIRHSRHDPSRPEHRQIERTTVEGRDLIGGLELVTQRVEESGFEPWLRQKHLSDPQPAIDRARDRCREHERSRAAAEAGRLGVQVGDIAGVRLQRRQRDDVLADNGSAESRRNLFKAARQQPHGTQARTRRRA